MGGKGRSSRRQSVEVQGSRKRSGRLRKWLARSERKTFREVRSQIHGKAREARRLTD